VEKSLRREESSKIKLAKVQINEVSSEIGIVVAAFRPKSSTSPISLRYPYYLFLDSMTNIVPVIVVCPNR
jgi:hypothetical protein